MTAGGCAEPKRAPSPAHGEAKVHRRLRLSVEMHMRLPFATATMVLSVKPVHQALEEHRSPILKTLVALECYAHCPRACIEGGSLLSSTSRTSIGPRRKPHRHLPYSAKPHMIPLLVSLHRSHNSSKPQGCIPSTCGAS